MWEVKLSSFPIRRPAFIYPVMAEGGIHQPHDKLFKIGFGDPVNAAAFLSGQLPPALSGVIGWDELKPEAGTFVDSHYRHSESDLLFSVPVHGRPGLLYVLFEHQLKCDPWIALRLLRYMVRSCATSCRRATLTKWPSHIR